jgi:hypothetical protein
MKRRALSSIVLFDVPHVDGTHSSNRKVPSTALGGLDGDEPAKALIEAQDQEIGLAPGRPRPAVKSVARSTAGRARRPATRPYGRVLAWARISRAGGLQLRQGHVACRHVVKHTLLA